MLFRSLLTDSGSKTWIPSESATVRIGFGGGVPPRTLFESRTACTGLLLTCAGAGTDALTSVVTVSTNASYITISCTNGLAESIAYVVRDVRSYRAGAASIVLASVRPSTPPDDDDAWTSSYGLGLQLFRHDGRVLYGHSGSMPGFLATLCVSAVDGLGGIAPLHLRCDIRRADRLRPPPGVDKYAL